MKQSLNWLNYVQTTELDDDSHSVKIIKDSCSHTGQRITTFQLRYWRAIHAELMTHRVFSRNASSSRAIPVKTMLKQVWNDPAGPIHWGVNRSGMQAKEELQGWRKTAAKWLWRTAGKAACVFAWSAMKIGLHKQVANRLLEPWQYIHVVLTATDFDNWDELRIHPDAQPEIRSLASSMRHARIFSNPTYMREGEWHLPYVSLDDYVTLSGDREDRINILKQVSAARCCRVSYLKHDGTAASVSEDFDLCRKLASSRPIHASPFEHVATPCLSNDKSQTGNFNGWRQYRKEVEQEIFQLENKGDTNA